jgi:hypothetical protein
MHESGDPLPDSSQLLQLHQRLLESDPVASSDLADACLDPLIYWLRQHNQRVDPHLCCEAAEEAIRSLIHNPASYRPDTLAPMAFLRMAAQRDLQNLLQRERKHHEQRRSLKCVELSSAAGKYLGRDDDPSLPLLVAEKWQAQLDSIPVAVRQGLTEAEARVLPLLLRKERKTAAYAEALGIMHLSPADQRKEVKRVKDRLAKRLKRAEGER